MFLYSSASTVPKVYFYRNYLGSAPFCFGFCL